MYVQLDKYEYVPGEMVTGKVYLQLVNAAVKSVLLKLSSKVG